MAMLLARTTGEKIIQSNAHHSLILLPVQPLGISLQTQMTNSFVFFVICLWIAEIQNNIGCKGFWGSSGPTNLPKTEPALKLD